MSTGADPGFQVRGGGAHLKKLRRAEGGAKIFWGISCEKWLLLTRKLLNQVAANKEATEPRISSS